MNFDRRAFLAACTAAAALSSRARAQAGDALRPEDFGARGDGATNDSRAFAALSAEANRRGGGTILLGPGRTYIVGEQLPGGGPFGLNPAPVLELRNLARPLRIIGSGARLRCQPGLRYGTFDTASGAPVHRPMPNYRLDEIATPYRAMIRIDDCRAAIEIGDLELDGNIERLVLGGRYGDTGWQIPASGLWLGNNHASETVTNLLIHHHGQDGVTIDGDDRRPARSKLSKVVTRYNGRQGVSIVGGRGYDFTDCEFSFTGRSAIHSAPGAGVDIEAEASKVNRDLTFSRCRFIDNAGVGMVADSGDSEGVQFTDCLFVGTTSWSAWPLKPRFAFDRCTFVGSVVHAYPDRNPARAARFHECRFTDDPSQSPSGKVYLGGGPIVNLAESDNVLFDRCTFELKREGVLPWSWRATYKDCEMSQVSTVPAMTKGKYLGRTTIRAPIDYYGSMVIGTLILNGKLVPPGAKGVPPW